MIKRILIGFIAILFLFVGALFILPGLVPTDTYREKLETELSRTFARDVKISGDIKISTFPSVKVQTGPVSLANPDGFKTNRFVDVDAMSAKVRLWPLLSKQVEISGVSLEKPAIFLEKRADGAVNWTLNDTAKSEPNDQSSGPFKRDGRYTEYDPSLDLLQIVDGTFSFTDAVSGQSIKAEHINIDLRAPSLKAPISLKGDLTYDGLPTILNASIASPFAFLSGSETTFDADLETAEGSLTSSGIFKQSEDIAFDADFNAESTSPLALVKRFPLPDTVELPNLSSVNASGNVSYAPGATRLPRVEVSALGEDLIASYSGAVDLTDGVKAAGDFRARLDDMTLITPYLDEPIDALNAVNSIETEASLDWNGTILDLQSLKAALVGPQLDATFEGQASFNETLSLNGKFSGNSPDIAALAKTAKISQEDIAALKRVTANGEISLRNNTLELSSLFAELSEGFVNGKFNGKLSYTEDLALAGDFSGNIPDLAALDQALPRTIPYSDVAKNISLSTDVVTSGSGLKFSNLTASLKDGLLTGDFTGRLAVGDNSDISGTLSLTADSLRAIASTQNIVMPPSTQVGAIFENFNVSGIVTGTPEKINFNNGKIGLDSLSGTGNFLLNLGQGKPRLTGDLIFSPLDIRPYMAAWSEQKPEGIILPWSTVPINLAGLGSLDADINITSPSVKLDRLEMGETKALVSLKNGILSTDVQKAQLYDGLVDGSFVISSKNGEPSLSVRADISSVAAQTFLKASAGLEKISGTANLSLAFDGHGRSQEDIMKSLTGSGSFKILNGQLLGIDATALLAGIDEALTNKSIPQGIGLGKITNFKDLNGSFSIDQGRATLGNFKLESGALFMDGEGLIDLGGQRLDFGLRPQLSEGSDLAQFGIPIEISGLFGQAKVGLDTDMLAEIAKAKARQTAGSAIRDQVSGPLGGILGDIISGGSSQETETPEDSDILTEETAPTSPSQSIADTTDSNVSSSTEDQTKQNEDQLNPEEQIENALKDLFGRKKKKSDTE